MGVGIKRNIDIGSERYMMLHIFIILYIVRYMEIYIKFNILKCIISIY